MRQLVLLGALVASLLLSGPALAAETCKRSEWPLWDLFRQHFVEESGRVIDPTTTEKHSTSEGQSYGMFFALVTGDQPTFDKLWRWSINNLGEGDLSKRLPAWQWGQAKDGSWGVLDDNSASDADLWFAYVLLEAGRLWDRADYTQSAHDLLELVEQQEVQDLPALGMMLLPGKHGFAHKDSWRLNPSYLPVPLLRRLELEFADGPWAAIARNTVKMLARVTPHGLAPDWTVYQINENGKASFAVDPDKGAAGSYDAIRNYMWAGMTPMADPLFRAAMISLDGMVALTRDAGVPPESVDTQTGEAQGEGPYGFSAALLPYLKAANEPELVQRQKQRVEALLRENLANKDATPVYYDFVLSLFGMGSLDEYYSFRQDGTLSLPWEKACLDITAK